MNRIQEVPHTIEHDGDICHPDDVGDFDAIGYTPYGADFSRDEAVLDEPFRGVSVPLGHRAANLLTALDKFAEYNSRRSFVNKLQRRLQNPRLGNAERAQITQSIATAQENMEQLEADATAAFATGYGLDVMAERPTLLTTDDGYPMEVQNVTDLGNQARFRFRSDYTAYKISDDSSVARNDELYRIGQNREALRRTLKRQA